MAITYRDAGVDIDAGSRLVERIKPFAKRTRTPEVFDGLGGFAGLCGLPAGIEDPLLVSGTDGVGTKLKVAFATGIHGTIGQDLVAMCVNDVLCVGAKPLFFLDYFACSKLDVDVAEAVIRGIADGCELAGCALLGGETAELPGMYADEEYDLAGFVVGVVSKQAILGPERVKVGDELIAIGSSGIHSNGYSLARRVLEKEMKLSFDAQVDSLDAPLGEVLLRPTKIYAKGAAALSAKLGGDLHGFSHITGGGITENLPRVLPAGTKAQVTMGHTRPAIFDVIQQGGPVDEAEMRRTFNLGVGLVAVVAQGKTGDAISALEAAGEKAWRLGEVTAGDAGQGASVTYV